MLDWGRVWSGLRATGHGLFYGIMGAVCIAFIVMGVIAVLDRGRPVHWGTFTEESTVCDSAPRGSCTHTGRWVSDDKTIVKNDIILDGVVEEGQSVRASYQPGGPMGDDENNIVHTPFWTDADLWFPWVAAAGSAAAVWYYHRRWRNDAADRRHMSRHARQPFAVNRANRASRRPMP